MINLSTRLINAFLKKKVNGDLKKQKWLQFTLKTLTIVECTGYMYLWGLVALCNCPS